MGRFSQNLVRLRQEAGFATAYAFYHRRGGRRAFPFTFSYYKRIERGDHLPRPEWVERLLGLLELRAGDPKRRELVVCLLRDLFAREADFQTLVAPLLRAPQEQAAQARATPGPGVLAADQADAVLADGAAFWVFQWLANTRGAWSPADLAQRLGLAEDAVRSALTRLAKRKLAARASSGLWSCPAPGSCFIFRAAPAGAAKSAAARYLDESAGRRGAVIQESRIMLRAEEGAARRVLAALETALVAAAADAAGRRDDGALVALEIRARKAFDF